MTILRAIAAAVSAVGIGLAASAASAAVYDVTYTAPSNGDFGSFELTLGSAGGGGYFNVTSVTGTWDTFAITGLLPVNGYAANDNLFSPTPSPNYFTFPGISFSTAAGIDINIANNGTAVYTEDRSDTDPGGTPQAPITSLTVTSVPEPGLWTLMLVGFGGAGYALRRRHGPMATA